MTKKLKPASAKVSPKESGDSPLKQFILTLIGSLPILLLMFACISLIKKDYAGRNNNFWAQDKHYSIFNTHDYYEETQCADDDYKVDRVQFKQCAPKHCGRYFTDYVITEPESDFLLNIAKKGLSHGEASGGASVFDIYNKVVSHKKSFISIKDKFQLTSDEVAEFNNVINKIKEQIKEKFQISNVYLTKPIFFSQMTNKKAETQHDEYWHKHIDKEQYEGFHYTTLIYLNTHHLDFYGGRFYWINAKENTTLSHSPTKGRLSIFTSGSENKHYVEKVKSGVRYAVTIPFTCNEKLAIDIK